MLPQIRIKYKAIIYFYANFIICAIKFILRLLIISVVPGSISPVRVVEIVITVFLSFNGSIAAYQSLQQDILTAPVQARPVFTVRQALGSAWSVRSHYCYYQLSLIS